jgi:predicted aldo/keto reductase-like oxidoreductase
VRGGGGGDGAVLGFADRLDHAEGDIPSAACTQKLGKTYPKITQKVHYAKITQKVRKNYARSTRSTHCTQCKQCMQSKQHTQKKRKKVRKKYVQLTLMMYEPVVHS